MADPQNSPTTESPSRPKAGQEFWALAALGSAALICLSLLAVALAVVLRGNSGGTAAPVQNIANIGTTAPNPGVNAGGIQRPAEPTKPQSERASAMDRTQPALPGVVATVTPQGGLRKMALTRADPPSPPSPSILPTPDPRKVFFRVRADAASLYQGQKALPMPIRYAPDAHGKVAEVFASHEPAKTDPRFSYAPDVAFTESGVRGHSLDLQLTQPRKTSSVDGFRAPQGFQFFTAKLRMGNQGAQPVAVRVDDLEVHDADGVRYLVNPELVVGAWPAPALAPKAEALVEVSFLVPESSPLKELAVQEAPGQWALVPLQAR